MMPEHPQSPDPQDRAPRIVAGAEARAADDVPADLEAAWRAWSSGLSNVNLRDLPHLRAAFDAGWQAARQGQPTRLDARPA